MITPSKIGIMIIIAACHHLCLLANAEIYPAGELGFSDIGGRQPDVEVGNYTHRIISGEYRDSERTEDCDVSKTFAKMNASAKYCNKKARPLGEVRIWFAGEHWEVQSISH